MLIDWEKRQAEVQGPFLFLSNTFISLSLFQQERPNAASHAKMGFPMVLFNVNKTEEILLLIEINVRIVEAWLNYKSVYSIILIFFVSII